MHHHCEIIMPPSNNISEDIKKIMAPFDENPHENEDEDTSQGFWDWYIIGGRWAGTKETCRHDPNKISAFNAELNRAGVTVSGIQCGKQELSPASQIPFVDKLWNDMFPTQNGEIVSCPLFNHSNNQYNSNDLLGCDIATLDDLPEKLNCSRVIIAGPNYKDDLAVSFMLCEDIWNGVNHMPIDWDGTVQTALAQFKETLSAYRKEYREKVTPQNNWLCVTIDYHS